MVLINICRLFAAAALSCFLANCASGSGGKKNYVYESLRPHQKVTLVYEGTTTVARTAGNGMVSPSDRRTASCRMEFVLTHNEGIPGVFAPGYAGVKKYWINGQLVNTDDVFKNGAMPTVWNLFTGVNSDNSLQMAFEELVSTRPSNAAYNKNTASVGSLVHTVIPNAGSDTVQGRSAPYALFQEKGRFLAQAHVSDSIPGRVTWCMYQTAADNGQLTDRVEVKLTSVKTE